MASGIRTLQRNAINKMLDLNRETDERGTWHDPWKILVYDAFCRERLGTTAAQSFGGCANQRSAAFDSQIH